MRLPLLGAVRMGLHLPPSSCRPGVVCFEERIEHCCSALREELRQLNQEAQSRVHSQLELAVRNLSATIRYQFLEPHGPCRRRVTVDELLVPR